LFSDINVRAQTEFLRIDGPKRDEIIGGWRKLHNEELRNLYSSSNIITMIKSRRMRKTRHEARMGEKGNVYRGLVRNPEGRRLLGRRICRWDDNIKMDHREIGCGDTDWINLAQDKDQYRALVNTVMKLRVP
jgi:hypothetical protein